MDRGLLSNQEVVSASREFVCVRLLTYESAEEGKFLESVFRGRGGKLENSVFAILAPDGTQLTRGGRSPEMVFGRRGGGDVATKMVAEMKRIATQYSAKEKEKRGLPVFEDLKRALNGASCDLQPLVVLADPDPKSRAAKEAELKALAWSPEFIGKFAYVVVSDLEELSPISGAEKSGARESGAESGAEKSGTEKKSAEEKSTEEKSAEKKSGVFVVQPDAYGLRGTVLSHTAESGSEAIAKALTAGSEAFKAVSKDSRRHIREGRRNGKNWEPEIPVTDSNNPRRGRG